MKIQLFIVTVLISVGVSAVPITDTVTIGDKEWAQVDLFTDLSWNEINAVCPAGNCGSGVLKTFDMEGWTWASAAEVGTFLFELNTNHTSGVRTVEHGDTLSPWLALTGFRVTAQNHVITDGFVLSGYTRDLFPGEHWEAIARTYYNRYIVNSTYWEDNTGLLLIANEPTGAWFYKSSANVPEPSSLILLSLGLLGLITQRSQSA